MLPEAFRQQAVEEGAEELPAQVGPAPFVAEYITQAAGIASYLSPFHQAHIGASAEDEGDAPLLAPHAPGGAQHIAVHLDSGLGKEFLKGLSDTLCRASIATARAIVENRLRYPGQFVRKHLGGGQQAFII